LRWDGNHWNPLAPPGWFVVTALAVSSDTLYAAGDLGDEGFIARFDGYRWESIAQRSSSFPQVAALGFFRGGLLSGGNLSEVGGVAANNIARWDGIGWHAVGSGLDGQVNSVFDADSQLIAVGNFASREGHFVGAASWDGSTWQSLPGMFAINGRAVAAAHG